PELVRATQAQHRGVAVVELFMAPGDIGRVIGRQGRTAQAVRGLVALAAEKIGGKAQVEFREQRWHGAGTGGGGRAPTWPAGTGRRRTIWCWSGRSSGRTGCAARWW